MAVTLGILLVLEVVSRVVLSRIYDRTFDQALIHAHKYKDSDGLKANAQGTVWGKPFHTDEIGGRLNPRRSSGHPKLLIMGDSVTEGVGVDDLNTFATLLSFAFPDSYRDPQTGVSLLLETENISLIGWSVTDYHTVLKEVLLNGKDSTIKKVYLFYCLNDIYGKTATSELPVMANKGVLSTINALLQDRYATYKLLKLLVYQHSDRYYQYDKALYKDEKRVTAAIDELVQIDRLCRDQNLEFSVFLLPYRSQVERPKDNLPQQTMAYHLGMNRIKWHDLLPLMAKEGNAGDMYLFADEIHLSEKGHQTVAKAVKSLIGVPN
jgi:lysophospholipase L1-like esterase